jgi:hypothetical protein
VLEGAVAVMENFQSVKGGDFREITWSKARYLQPPPPVRLQYERDSGWYIYVPESDVERAILEALEINEEPMNKRDLMEVLDEKEGRVAKALKMLVAEDRIVRMSSQSGPGGSTGYRYTLKRTGEEGGLGF